MNLLLTPGEIGLACGLAGFALGGNCIVADVESEGECIPLLRVGERAHDLGAFDEPMNGKAVGQRTNLFVMGVGYTSCGKDHALKAVSRILDDCEATNLRLGQVTSDSAVEYALRRNPRACAARCWGGRASARP